MKKNTQEQELTIHHAALGNAIPSIAQLAFTPTEFAALFNRQKVWGYRQIYAGHVKVIKYGGRLLIPRSEVESFLSKVSVYNGKQKRSPASGVKVEFTPHTVIPQG